MILSCNLLFSTAFTRWQHCLPANVAVETAVSRFENAIIMALEVVRMHYVVFISVNLYYIYRCV